MWVYFVPISLLFQFLLRILSAWHDGLSNRAKFKDKEGNDDQISDFWWHFAVRSWRDALILFPLTIITALNSLYETLLWVDIGLYLTIFFFVLYWGTQILGHYFIHNFVYDWTIEHRHLFSGNKKRWPFRKENQND
jgi:hypothetical protein